MVLTLGESLSQSTRLETNIHRKMSLKTTIIIIVVVVIIVVIIIIIMINTVIIIISMIMIHLRRAGFVEDSRDPGKRIDR